MKKILLFIGLSMFSFGAFAEKVPSVVVNKSQGGLTAIVNLYNYVHYTPAEASATGIGQLDCSGSGFTACRVPNCSGLNVIVGNSVTTVTDLSKIQALKNAVNDVINQYEVAQNTYAQAVATNGNSTKGTTIPSKYSKTIAFTSPASSSSATHKLPTETYVVSGVVTSSTANASTMKIYIEKVNLTSAYNN